MLTALDLEIGWGAMAPPAHWPLRPRGSHWSTTGLVGSWSMQEGQGPYAYDLSGEGNHGLLTNGPTWVAGPQADWALELDNTDDVVVLTDTETGVLDFTGGPFSFVMRAKVNSTTSQCLIAKRAGSGDIQYFFRINGGPLSLLRTGGNVAANTTPSTGAWHQFVVVVEADGTGTFYLDGRSDGTFASESITHKAFDVGLGNRVDLGGNWELDGQMDYCAIYNRAVPAQHIAWLHKYPSTPYLPPMGPWVLASVAPPATSIPALQRYYRNLRTG